MRELKCQAAALLGLGKEFSLTMMASYFFTELKRARRKTMFKFTMTAKKVMGICRPLHGIGILLNVIRLHPLIFLLLIIFVNSN